MTKRWPTRLVAFFLWAMAALSLAYWLLKFVGVSEQPIAVAQVAAQAPTLAAGDLARVLGPATAAPANAVAAAPQAADHGSRMQLLGIVANRRNIGVALISVEGQPARPYRVGSQIAGSHTLVRVTARSATLSPAQQGAPTITLELASPGVHFPPRQAAWGGIKPIPVAPAVPGVDPGAPLAPGSRAVLPAPPVDASEPAKD